jgi:hypothetical protein
MLLTKNGIDLIFHLSEGAEIGAWNTGVTTPLFKLDAVRFVAHEVALDATFYDRLRASVSASNGVLSMAGTTYRHYLNLQAVTVSDTTSAYPLNITTRVKSLKALITRTMVLGQESNKESFSVGCGFNPFIYKSAGGVVGSQDYGNAGGKGSYQYRIGSVLHPATSVEVSAANIGESIQELRKAWGTIGDYSHGTNMTKNSCIIPPNPTVGVGDGQQGQLRADGSGSGGRMANYAFGIDLEAFSKTATESGVNVADRALNVSMQLQLPAGADYTARFDTYAMCDCIYYVGIDGSITTRI